MFRFLNQVLGINSKKILKKGLAMRVIFFYPGEEGTYVENANVTLFENGIVHIRSNNEETTTHLQNCEILWSFEVEGEERLNKVRLLKPDESASKTEVKLANIESKFSKTENKLAKVSLEQNPEI